MINTHPDDGYNQHHKVISPCIPQVLLDWRHGGWPDMISSSISWVDGTAARSRHDDRNQS